MTPQDIVREMTVDVTFNRLTMIEKQMDRLPLLVKWQSRKYKLKQELYEAESSSDDMFESIVESVMTDSEINLTKMAATKLAEKHEDWIKYKKLLNEKKLCLEAIEDAIANVKGLGYALRDLQTMLHDEIL